MRQTDLIGLSHGLRLRRESIADAWYDAIAPTAFVRFPAADVRRELGGMIDLAISFLLAEQPDSQVVRRIGTRLAEMHYLQPDSLSQTLEALVRGLLEGMPEQYLPFLWPRTAALQRGIAAGFMEATCAALLKEQEMIRRALVSELAAAQDRLLEARDLLEEKVRERTADLAHANERLLLEIAERLRAEAWLRTSEERYRELVRSIDAAIVRVDRQGTIQYISPPAERLLGYPVAEILGRPFLGFLLPEAIPDTLEKFRRVLDGATDVTDYPSRVASGEVRWFRGHFGPVYEEGHVVGASGILTDITDRKRAEDALRASEERWRSLVETAPDLVLTFDRDGTIIYVNRVPLDADYTVQDVLGRKGEDLVLPEHRGRLTTALCSVFETGRSVSYEVAVPRSDGRMVWYSARVAALRHQGQVAQALLIARDITERKMVEDIKDSAIRDVAHELRAPLAKMQMSLDLLEESLNSPGDSRAAAVGYIQLARETVGRLLDTLGAVLDLSALEAGVPNYAFLPFRVGALLREVVEEMEPLARRKNLALRLDVSKRLPRARGDREKLRRVLVNLLDNACKFSNSGEIVVSAAARADGVEIAVGDCGLGILSSNLERVFTKFFKEDPNQRGVGLGLPLCRAIIQAHGGRIWAESAGRGKGTTVRFTLPYSTTGAGESKGSGARAPGGDGLKRSAESM